MVEVTKPIYDNDGYFQPDYMPQSILSVDKDAGREYFEQLEMVIKAGELAVEGET